MNAYEAKIVEMLENNQGQRLTAELALGLRSYLVNNLNEYGQSITQSMHATQEQLAQQLQSLFDENERLREQLASEVAFASPAPREQAEDAEYVNDGTPLVDTAVDAGAGVEVAQDAGEEADLLPAMATKRRGR